MTREDSASSLDRMKRDENWEPGRLARVRDFQYINGFAADLTDDEVAQLNKSPQVRWIEPVIERHALSDSVTSGAQTTPYGINMVHAPDVWPVTKGLATDGKTVIHVAVIDTGTRYTDPELAAAYKGGHNFVAGSDDPYDDEGHGTHVAGTIVAADDGRGVVGVAPQAELYSLKALDQCGSGTTENIINSVEWIITKKSQIGGNWVVNLSLGSDTPSDAEKAEFQKAQDNGVLVFAAAGNGYDPTAPTLGLAYPAGYPSVVSVGAIDVNQVVADFSQRGPDLKVVAPGVDVLSTFWGGHVTTADGHKIVGTLPSASDSSGNPVCLPMPNVSGKIVFCNYGGSAADFPASVKGNIALIQRGPAGANAITFVTKVTLAKAAGALGVILFDHTDEMVFPPGFTISRSSLVIPTILVSKADGATLQAAQNSTVTIASAPEDSLWANLSGTSMATPHAAGVAALVWAVAPTATANAVATAIEQTAVDLETPGFDNNSGNGLVNALNAAKQLNPAAFSSGSQPSTTPVTGRHPGRRGH